MPKNACSTLVLESPPSSAPTTLSPFLSYGCVINPQGNEKQQRKFKK